MDMKRGDVQLASIMDDECSHLSRKVTYAEH